MATRRPLAFGMRLRDKERGKTVQIHTASDHFVVEDDQTGRTGQRRRHRTVPEAVHDAAVAWRRRLH